MFKMSLPPDYPFDSHYQDVSGYRLHYLDEGEQASQAILFLHGVPTWSYTFRKIIPACTLAGYRVIALDLPGFGLSDKAIPKNIWSLDWLVTIVGDFINRINIRGSVLFAHDWGGIIGLLLASSNKELFSGIILCNSLLPVSGMRIPLLFKLWRLFARCSPVLPLGHIVNMGSNRNLTQNERRGYGFPFGSEIEKRAIRILPRLLPIGSGYPGYKEIEKAWTRLAGWTKPVLTLFSDGDSITRGGEKIIQGRIPGALKQNHLILRGGHFVQEDAPSEISYAIIEFMKTV